MAQKVAKAGVKQEDGFLYFIDKQGDISRAKMARGGKKRRKTAESDEAGTKEERKGFCTSSTSKATCPAPKMVRR